MEDEEETDDFLDSFAFSLTPPCVMETCRDCKNGSCTYTNGEQFRISDQFDLNKTFNYGDVDHLGRRYHKATSLVVQSSVALKADPSTLCGAGCVSNLHHPSK